MQRLIFRAIRRFLRPVKEWPAYWDTVVVLESLASLGQGVSIKGPVYFGNPEGTRLAEDICINPHFSCLGSGNFRIGAHSHFGKHITILTSNHNFERPDSLPYDKTHLKKDVIIEPCVWVGEGVIIVPGVRVGEGAVLAGGGRDSKRPAAGSCRRRRRK